MSSLTPRLDKLERNLIINGAMEISQRHVDNSIAMTNGGVSSWPVDRFRCDWKGNQSGVTAQRVTDAPPGFSRSIKLTVGTGAAIVTDNYLTAEHRIEGYNFNQLNFGNSEASSFTLAFWVKSSIAGTFGMLFTTASRRYLTTYTINSTDTWEKKIINVPADSVASNTTTGIGMRIGWIVCMSSNNLVSEANSWVTGGYAVNNTITNTHLTITGSTFQLAGVQLVAGTHNSLKFANAGQTFQEELMLCQRYFEKSYDLGTAVGAATSNGSAMAGSYLGSAYAPSWMIKFFYKQEKRTNPTIKAYDWAGTVDKLTTWTNGITTNNQSINNYPLDGGTSSGSIGFNGTVSGVAFNWTADAEL